MVAEIVELKAFRDFILQARMRHGVSSSGTGEQFSQQRRHWRHR